MERTEYLGDGVYAEYDEYGTVVLDLRGQDPAIRIVLEPEVLQKLVAFAAARKVPGFAPEKP